MTSDDLSAAIRHTALVVLLATAIALAGCTSAGATYTQPSDSGPIQITDVGISETLLSTAAWVDATVAPVENATAVVWLGADGAQIGAVRLQYGTNKVNIEGDTSVESVYGQNRLVIVRGGETNCFGDHCSHVGGTEIANTTFEVRSE